MSSTLKLSSARDAIHGAPALTGAAGTDEAADEESSRRFNACRVSASSQLLCGFYLRIRWDAQIKPWAC